MDPACLEHCLTDVERSQFEDEGYLIVPQALPEEMVARLTAAVDRIHARKRSEGLGPHDSLFFPNFIPEDNGFIELIDWPRTFPKVWGILGWNIYLYHAHLGVNPPRDPSTPKEKKRLGWHQDSGRVNVDIETSPRPRISLKVGYFLSDVSEPGRGNFYVVPGSHRRDALNFHEDEASEPEGAQPVCVSAGAAVLFDRRLWHSASPNDSTVTRKVLFYGYGYRWIRTKDDMTVQHLYDRLDPIRRQILGDGVNANGHFSPKDEDVPLRVWLKEQGVAGVECRVTSDK